MIAWKCCWNTRDSIPNRRNQYSNSNLLVDLDEHLLPWQDVWLSSNQCWSLRAVSARSSSKLMGWCWKPLFYMSCVSCKNEKKHQQLQNFKLWMGGQERTTFNQHVIGWTGNGSSFEALFPRFGSFVSSLFGTLTVVAGWSSGRNCWAPQKPRSSVTPVTPKIPNSCLNFEMFFDFEETDQQNTKNL